MLLQQDATQLGHRVSPDIVERPEDAASGELEHGPKQTSTFPGSSVQAGDRARTGDIQLGRLALYQLSYTRVRLA